MPNHSKPSCEVVKANAKTEIWLKKTLKNP